MKNGLSFELIDYIKDVADKLVTKAEFDPIKSIVYGLVGLILIAVVGAILSLILRS